ncbi:hypothetical protein FY526_26615, partial [Clostridioides difficile]
MKKRMRLSVFIWSRTLFALCIISSYVIGLSINDFVYAAIDPYGPKSMKSPVLKSIQAEKTVGTPGVYWYQTDDGRFKADHSGGPT